MSGLRELTGLRSGDDAQLTCNIDNSPINSQSAYSYNHTQRPRDASYISNPRTRGVEKNNHIHNTQKEKDEEEKNIPSTTRPPIMTFQQTLLNHNPQLLSRTQPTTPIIHTYNPIKLVNTQLMTCLCRSQNPRTIDRVIQAAKLRLHFFEKRSYGVGG